ncbi:hypothetical protein NMG60_11008166 [Bertholletia excelsa]
MISLIYFQSGFSTTVTIIFFTCVLIPFFQIKKAVFQLIGSFFTSENDFATSHQGICSADLLPVARYDDLNSCPGGVEAETCSICLAEYQKEDRVSKLPKCGHVFHNGCIQDWMDRDHLTCPLCRSSFLHSLHALCHAKY